MKMHDRYIHQREITIIVTHACNLRCRYCYYDKVAKGERSAVPDIAKIKRLLTDEFNAHKIPVRITYHGGEPLINWHFIRDLSEWVWTIRPDVEFLVTTNGTILNDEMKRWFKAHQEKFTVVLSIDGPKEVHDLGRPNSFDRIDRRFFADTYPTVGVKMTVTPMTLPVMFESFCFLHDQGFYVNPSLAREVKWDLDTDLLLYESELAKLSEWYLANPKIPPAELLGIDFLAQPVLLTDRHFCACGAGRGMIAYDMDGKAYPCHSFIDFKRNVEQTELDGLFDLLQKNDAQFLNSPCAQCFYAPWCSPCYGLSYVNRGTMGRLDPQMCRFAEVTIPLAAKMQGEMLIADLEYSFMNRFSEKERFAIGKTVYTILKAKRQFGHIKGKEVN